VITLLALIIGTTFFGPAFWSIAGVGIGALGLVGGWFGSIKRHGKDKKEEGLSLYVHFVDDLQVELKRLHGLVVEERSEMVRVVKEKDAIIAILQDKIDALTQEIQKRRL
jgi:hypothetical protein